MYPQSIGNKLPCYFTAWICNSCELPWQSFKKRRLESVIHRVPSILCPGFLWNSNSSEKWLSSARNIIKPVSFMEPNVLSALSPCMTWLKGSEKGHKSLWHLLTPLISSPMGKSFLEGDVPFDNALTLCCMNTFAVFVIGSLKLRQSFHYGAVSLHWVYCAILIKPN